MKKEYHFFVSSCFYWNTGTDLEKLLRKQRLLDQNKKSGYKAETCVVYKVPLPIDAKYSIDNYAPLVEGIEFIDKIEY